MPTYSYRCQACGIEFDIQQAFTDTALTTCDGCGGSLRKLFSAVGVTFNGSGFYRTDSRASSSSTSPSTSSSTPPASTPSATPSQAPASPTS